MFYYLLLIVLGLTILHVYTRHFKYRHLNTIPTLQPLLPVLGNMWILAFANRNQTWQYFRDAFTFYKPIVTFWSLTFPSVLVYDPDDIKTVLNDKVNIDKSSFYKYIETFALGGLITMGADKWTQRRKLMNPAFHTDVLKKYLHVANVNVADFVEYMSEFEDVSTQNLSSIASKLTLSIMTETSMGVHYKFYEKTMKYYEHLAEEAYDIVVYRSVRPYIPNWMFQFLSKGRTEKRVVGEAIKFAMNIIKERKAYHESRGYKNMQVTDENGNVTTGNKTKFATLDHMIWLERKGLIDELAILEETQTFIAAAHDTTSQCLLFTLLMFAENEEVQERARKEVTAVIDRLPDKTMTMEAFKDLPYLDRCLKESLRIYPPAHMIGRNLRQDLKLKNHTVSAGADLILSPYDTHRNPEHWPEPLKFDPDRFLPEEVEKRHPYSYIPFSAGPRSCIGKKLAQITLKTLFAQILYNFKLESVTKTSDIIFELSVVLKSADPVYMRFIKIKH